VHFCSAIGPIILLLKRKGQQRGWRKSI
jgi:hypothetical protein